MGVEPLRGVKSSACATGRISFSFADFEEKRTEDAHGLDEYVGFLVSKDAPHLIQVLVKHKD